MAREYGCKRLNRPGACGRGRGGVFIDGRDMSSYILSYGSAICRPTRAARGRPVVSVGVRPTS